MKRNHNTATLRLATLLALALAGAVPAQAQNLRPGLWELGNTMQSSSGAMEKAMAEAQKQMAALPAEQRKMMQDMMAKQGVAMGAGGPGAMAVKVCMTAEMLARNEVVTQQGDCKSQHAPRAGNTMKFAFTCTQPPSRGDGEVTFESPQAYRSHMNVTTSAGGKPEQFTVRSNGKWLSDDCGTIKPLAAGRP
jgi:hypothetical protein